MVNKFPLTFKVFLWLVIFLANSLFISDLSSAAPTYKFPVQGCSVKFTKFHHDYPATDIIAKRGCAVVAVINGTVDEVSSKGFLAVQVCLGQVGRDFLHVLLSCALANTASPP